MSSVSLKDQDADPLMSRGRQDTGNRYEQDFLWSCGVVDLVHVQKLMTRKSGDPIIVSENSHSDRSGKA